MKKVFNTPKLATYMDGAMLKQSKWGNFSTMMRDLNIESFDHHLGESLSRDRIMLNLQCSGIVWQFDLLGVHIKVTTMDIITTTNCQTSYMVLADKMIQFLKGMPNEQITITSQKTNVKGKVIAMEHDTPRHVSHGESGDSDDDDDDGHYARHNNDHDHDDSHIIMETINLVEPRITHLGEASGEFPMEQDQVPL